MGQFGNVSVGARGQKCHHPCAMQEASIDEYRCSAGKQRIQRKISLCSSIDQRQCLPLVYVAPGLCVAAGQGTQDYVRPPSPPGEELNACALERPVES